MTDILDELKAARCQLVQDAPHRAGEAPGVDIAMLNAAIDEIERLRAQVAQLQRDLQQR